MSSPQLDEPMRSPERAALDIAVKAMMDLRFVSHTAHWDRTGGSGTGCPACIRQREVYENALAKIEAIVPGSTERGVGNP